MIQNFTFDSGETLDELELHYKTLGVLKVFDNGSTNAVHIMHGSTAEGGQFLNEDFAGVLFNSGQVLDAEKYFIILRDGIGHGNSSNPRNTGLRAKFPSYQYSDMVRADHRLLTEGLGVNHTRLTMGVSMGGMHTFLWGEMFPDFADALMPIASLPVQIAGHNRLWRKMLVEIIRNDPGWQQGEHETQPLVSFTGAISLIQVMLQGQAYMQAEYPTRAAVDKWFGEQYKHLLENADEYDVNSQLYAWNASYTYDAEPNLASIKVPLTAVNTADDLMNPPELRILERTVRGQMVKGLGKAVVIPTSNKTIGHGSYILAELWKDELEQLLYKTAILRNV